MGDKYNSLGEIVFQPSYSVKTRLGAPFMFFLGGIFVFVSIMESGLAEFLFGCACLFMGLMSFVLYPVKMVFGINSLIVRRRIFPAREFKYSDFTDIGTTAIKFGKRTVPLTNIKNKQELGGIISQLIDEGKIHPSQIQGKLAVAEDLTRRTVIISLIPVLVIGLILNFYEITLFQVNGIFLAMLVVYPIVYLTLKLQSENDDL